MNKRRNRRKNQQKRRKIFISVCRFLLVAIVLGIGIVCIKGDKQSSLKIENVSSESNIDENASNESNIGGNEEMNSSNKKDNEQENMDVEIDTSEQRVNELLSSLSLEEKVAQLFIVLPEQLVENGDLVTAAGEATRDAIFQRPVGGIVYFSANLISPEQTQTMMYNVQQYSLERIKVPMFLCVDEEGGQVARLASNGGFDLPVFDNMSIIGNQNDASKALEIGETIGEYLYEFGFNTDFAPVADVFSNSNNQVVRYRSFGDNPDVVKTMTRAVSRGLESKKILSMYKHFPGHGDTTADTHEGYACSEKTKEELYDCELIPFLDGIENHVPFIMIGHISFPNIVGDDTPASLSEAIVKDLLIDELHYDGIIITDALKMGAISQKYSSSQAAVKALNGGVDMLLMPDDFNAAYEGVLSAVQSGEISEERINESVYKILKTKIARLE